MSAYGDLNCRAFGRLLVDFYETAREALGQALVELSYVSIDDLVVTVSSRARGDSCSVTLLRGFHYLSGWSE